MNAYSLPCAHTTGLTAAAPDGGCYACYYNDHPEFAELGLIQQDSTS